MNIGSNSRLYAGVAIGIAAGVAIGAFLDSVAIGVATGVGIGAALGVAWSQPTKQRHRAGKGTGQRSEDRRSSE